jgi:hypothetical protein
MLLVIHLDFLDFLKPVVITPHCIMIIGFQVHGFWFSDSDSPIHKLGLIVIIDGWDGVLPLIELDKCISFHFFCDVIDGYLDWLDFSEGIEEGENNLLGDSFGKVADINCSFVIVLVNHSLLNVYIKSRHDDFSILLNMRLWPVVKEAKSKSWVWNCYFSNCW